MGLAERRGIEDFKSSRFEALRDQVTEAAGFAVPIEIDWESIAEDGRASLYDEAIPKGVFRAARRRAARSRPRRFGKDGPKIVLEEDRVVQPDRRLRRICDHVPRRRAEDRSCNDDERR